MALVGESATVDGIYLPCAFVRNERIRMEFLTCIGELNDVSFDFVVSNMTDVISEAPKESMVH